MSGIYIIKKGITNFDTDAIVNAANSHLAEGGGVCGAIFFAAGSAELTKACKAIGHCDTGNAVITPGFNLDAKYIIHAVGPKWVDGKHGEPSKLYDAYKNSLELAMNNNLHSITFPLISAGIYGYPMEGSWRKGIRASKNFFKHFPDYEMDIYFAVLDDITKTTGEVILKTIEAEDEKKPAVDYQALEEKAADISDEPSPQKQSTKEDRIAVFKDTQNWCESDPDLKAAIEKAKKNTEIFWEDNYPAFDQTYTKPLTVSVTKERSFEAAMRLKKENHLFNRIAVMNFANAFRPGGGVEKGASAQEECLCRTSTLYPLLRQNSMREFYDYHKNKGTSKASDSLIYTEGVIICKTDEDLPKRMPQKDWTEVDVITIAAPDLRTSPNQYAPLADSTSSMNDAELFAYHVKRAVHMLTVAAYKKAEILVLGAFGCGAFQNNPEVVAKAYRAAIQEFPCVFREIVFAVYCPPGRSKNYDIFRAVLGNGVFAPLPKFKILTDYIEKLEGDEYGYIHAEEGHAGTMDDPVPMPFPHYSDTVQQFIKDIHEFSYIHQEYDFANYLQVLEDAGIKDPECKDDEKPDAKLTLAKLFYIVRQERFCDGLILEHLKSGNLQRLLKRLKKIDENETIINAVI